jgi:hypothetical protein
MIGGDESKSPTFEYPRRRLAGLTALGWRHGVFGDPVDVKDGGAAARDSLEIAANP